MAKTMFTHWGRAANDGRLDLWVQGSDGRAVERAALDVTELPQRPDVLERMPPKMKERMLWEAREVANGNLTLSPSFPGYSQEDKP